MAEPMSRIESTTSYHERDANLPQPRGREKRRPKLKPAYVSAELAGPEELEEQEKHALDTLA